MIVTSIQRAAFILFACVATSVYAQQKPVQLPAGYPNKPLRMVVGIPPGGGADIVSRVVAQKLAERWGQPVIVDNRTGAGGGLAMGIVAQSAADGYTFLVGSVVTIASATPLGKVTFDTQNVFSPVIKMNSQPYVLAIAPSLPVNSVKELITYARRMPGKLNYASTGVGSTSQLGMELFKSMAGVDIVHVPYRGLSLAMVDLMGGQIQLMLGAAIIITPNVRTGKLKALAVSSDKRARVLPNLPTISESGLAGFEWSNSYALFAPAGTPPVIVLALNREVGEIVRLASVQSKLAADGVDVVAANSPKEFKEIFESEVDKIKKLLEKSGIRL